MKIERALDWNQVSDDLCKQLVTIGYNPDLRKMLKNIDKMKAEDLRKAEIKKAKNKQMISEVEVSNRLALDAK